MASLRRTRVGPFTLKTAIPLADLTEETLPGLLVSPSEALSRFPSQQITDDSDVDAVRHGRALLSSLPASPVTRILDVQGLLIALGRADGERLHPFKVFVL